MTQRFQWGSNVPKGWRVLPLRTVADYVVSNVDKVPLEGEVPVRLCNYSDVYNNQFITQQIEFMPCTATQEEIHKFHLEVDDVIITKDSESWNDIGVPALVAETADDLVCGYHLALLRPHRDKLLGRFLLRCLQSKTIRLQLELAANGVTRFGLPKAEIGSMRLPVPPLSVQHSIVEALDRESSQIDALVIAKQRILDLLTEKRKAIVASAVTRGVVASSQVRESGVSWLGSIPKHWSVEQVRWLFRERDQRGEPDLPLMEVSIANGVTVREFTGDKIESTAADFNTYKVARKNDIVFNKMRMWQGAVGVSPVDGLVSPDYVVATPKGQISPDYCSLLFRTDVFSAECGRRSHGLTWDRLRIYWEEFREIQIPLPPHDEQQAIVGHIARTTAKLDSVRSATENTIALLKERRSALIGEAVTGQIDVEAS